MSYPATSDANLDYRANLLFRAETDLSLREALKDKCTNDILYWINTFVWTYDPRGDRSTALGYTTPNMPFITWPFQDDYILDVCESIDNSHDLLTEKSRDMGASWLLMVIFIHYWLFKGPGNDFLVGSRKEKYVDELGNMSTLFQKIRYVLKRLPVWMLPKGYDKKRNDNYLRFENPETGSMIHGEANNDNFGTSGRVKACMLDEFSKWKHTDEAAWQSLSDVTACKLPVSSANGRSNHFYKLRAGKAGEIKIARLEWRDHPLKTEGWYQAEKKRRSPADLAAEVDIDYTASVTNKACPSFSHSTHCGEPVRHNSLAVINLCCDFNINPMSWALNHEDQGVSYFFAEHTSHERMTTAEHAETMFTEWDHHRTKTMYVYGDASGKSGSVQSLKSNYQIIKEIGRLHGWNVVLQIPGANPHVSDRLDITDKRLRDWEHDGKSWVKIDPSCVDLINSFEQTQRKGEGVDKTDNVEHILEAVGYYFAYKFPIRKNEFGQVKRY